MTWFDLLIPSSAFGFGVLGLIYFYLAGKRLDRQTLAESERRKAARAAHVAVGHPAE